MPAISRWNLIRDLKGKILENQDNLGRPSELEMWLPEDCSQKPKYHNFMNEYLQMGVKRPIELACKEDVYFCFPHCLVFTKSSSIIFMSMSPCIVNHCQLLSNKMRLCTFYYISVNCSTCFGW
jgi:hypothetical protein